VSKQKFKPQHRRALWAAHSYRCFYCRCPLSWDGLRIDHVVPEHLSAEPGRLLQLKRQLCLDSGWRLTDDHNLVPSCDPCNHRKLSSLLAPNQLILLLTKVGEKLSEVSRLRGQYERDERADRLSCQLEIALATGLLTETDVGLALAKAAAGDDLIQLTTSLEFVDGAPLSSLRPSAAQELLDRPVCFGADMPEGLELKEARGGSRSVRTCREYREALQSGFYCDTNFAIKVASSFQVTLGVLEALSACRPSVRSFIRHPRKGLCDADLLPSSLLPLLGPLDEQYERTISQWPTIGAIVAAGKAQIRRVSSSSIAIETDESGVYMREMLRADLDGDGYEDVLVSTYFYAVHGTMGFASSPLVLARRDFSGNFATSYMVASPANLDSTNT